MADAEMLFAAHRDGVFRYLSRIVGAGEAKELTQEVFLRVARGPVPLADGAGRRAWVFTIARNLALNRAGRGSGAPHRAFDVDLWLVHSVPGRDDRVLHQVLPVNEPAPRSRSRR